MIESITILSGHGRNDRTESFGRIDFRMGQVVSIVGPTRDGEPVDNHVAVAIC